MKQLEKLITILDLPHINIQYSGSIQVLNERAILNMRYEESLICSRAGHGQSYCAIMV